MGHDMQSIDVVSGFLLITGFGAVLGIAYVVAAGIAREGRAQVEIDERRRAQSRASYLQDPISRSAGQSRKERSSSPSQTPTGSSDALRGTVLRRQPASAIKPASPDDSPTGRPAVAD